jgi:hypothetical protein
LEVVGWFDYISESCTALKWLNLECLKMGQPYIVEM